MISSFLSNRKHRAKINSGYSNWEDLLLGVSQEYIYVYIYMCVCVCAITESGIANYMDDLTLNVHNRNMNGNTKKL